jgi:hypothetical protein
MAKITRRTWTTKGGNLNAPDAWQELVPRLPD